MRARFAGTLKTHSFKKIYCAVKADHLQTQRLLFSVGARLQLTDQQAADAAIPEGRQERNINAANLMFARIDEQPAGAFAVAQDYFVARALVVVVMKLLLRFILHVEELADTIFIPT